MLFHDSRRSTILRKQAESENWETASYLLLKDGIEIYEQYLAGRLKSNKGGYTKQDQGEQEEDVTVVLVAGLLKVARRGRIREQEMDN